MVEHNHSHEIRVPRSALIGIAAILVATLAGVFWFRVSGSEPVSQVPVPGEVIKSRQLRFEDGPDGTVSVYEVSSSKSDELIRVIGAGEGGFIRGLMRGLARSRRASNLGPELPFILSQQADGALFLEDSATGQRIFLQAFGPDSARSFESLLDRKEAQP